MFAVVVHWRAIVIKGHVDLSFVTEEMLFNLDFTESSEVSHGNGLWEELGVKQPNFNTSNTRVWQMFDSLCPPWANKVKRMFNWIDYSTVTINKLEPGTFIPTHSDTLYRLKQHVKEQNIDTQNYRFVRINIFLQNRYPGHFLDIDNVAISQYNKGDYVIISPGVLHTVANLGWTNRYTMQITGITTKKEI